MPRRKLFKIRLPSSELLLGECTLLMGILNVTPDSFSDGGKFLTPEVAIDHGLELEAAGADILDIGGESTRPGSAGISAEEELHRVLPVIHGLRGRLHIPISIDTSKSAVAEAAAESGAQFVNDVTALRADPLLAEIVARRKLGLILMHMRGNPLTMQEPPFASDIFADVSSDLRVAVDVARRAGVRKSQIILDPGLGFGKTYEQNFELIARLPQFARLGFPLMLGPSRKSFLGRAVGGASKDERLWPTAGAVAACVLAGAHIVRVHDVREMLQVARVSDVVAQAIASSKRPSRQSRRNSHPAHSA